MFRQLILLTMPHESCGRVNGLFRFSFDHLCLRKYWTIKDTGRIPSHIPMVCSAVCVLGVCAFVRSCVCVCVLDVYDKVQAQIISNCEFKLWTFLQETESREATFLAETYVMSHQSLSPQTKTKSEWTTAVEFGGRTLSQITAVVRMFRLVI